MAKLTEPWDTDFCVQSRSFRLRQVSAGYYHAEAVFPPFGTTPRDAYVEVESTNDGMRPVRLKLFVELDRAYPADGKPFDFFVLRTGVTLPCAFWQLNYLGTDRGGSEERLRVAYHIYWRQRPNKEELELLDRQLARREDGAEQK